MKRIIINCELHVDLNESAETQDHYANGNFYVQTEDGVLVSIGSCYVMHETLLGDLIEKITGLKKWAPPTE